MADEKLDKIVLLNEISEKVSGEVQIKLDKLQSETQVKIDAAKTEAVKGLITQDEFQNKLKEETDKLNEAIKRLEQVEDASKDQGSRINALSEKGAPGSKSLDQFLAEQLTEDKLKSLRKGREMIEIPMSMIKAAGVSSISNTVQSMDSAPTSPYLPGLGGPDLDFFDIARNPNYILNQVDIGRTDQKRLAWLNETGEDGLPAEVDEGNPKPLISSTFKVAMSEAKKMAAYYEITEELEDDVPQVATLLRRMLRERLLRAWDDVIQTAVQGVATNYSMPGLAGSIPFGNYWDALYAMMCQVRTANFIPTSIGINPQTNVKMQADKNSNGTYLLPPFKDEITRMLTQANKVPVDNAFVGDLTNFKVDIYKEFVIKIGWINDNFINNKFCVLAEQRYHRYISDNRKTAIVKGNLGNVRASIDGGSGS